MAVPIVRKGAQAALARKSGNFLGVGENESLEFAPIISVDEIISFDQHVFWHDEPENTVMFPCLQEKSCPGCLMGNKPRLRVLILVAYKDEEGTLRAGILPVGLSVLRTLVDLNSAMPNGIRGKTMVLRRSGSGLRTRYTLMATGGTVKNEPEHDLDPEASVGETDRDEIIRMLVDGEHDVSPIERFDAAAKKAAKSNKGKPPKEEAPFEADEDGGTEDGDSDWA